MCRAVVAIVMLVAFSPSRGAPVEDEKLATVLAHQAAVRQRIESVSVEFDYEQRFQPQGAPRAVQFPVLKKGRAKIEKRGALRFVSVDGISEYQDAKLNEKTISQVVVNDVYAAAYTPNSKTIRLWDHTSPNAMAPDVTKLV